MAVVNIMQWKHVASVFWQAVGRITYMYFTPIVSILVVMNQYILLEVIW